MDISTPQGSAYAAEPFRFRWVLFPGRHHLLTAFQQRYLTELLEGRHSTLSGRRAVPLPGAEIVAAVTSSDHDRTRRNPIPYHRREAQLTLLAETARLSLRTYPVPDTPPTDRFASYTISTIEAASDGTVTLDPSDTLVACSTPKVFRLYQSLGFEVVTVELDGYRTRSEMLLARLPFQLVEALASDDEEVVDSARFEMAEASVRTWDRYRLRDRLVEIFSDGLVGEDGDITDHRDYQPYAAAFDEGAARKWEILAPHVRPGRVVDLGCGVGSLLAEAGRDPRLAESDLVGVEVARPLFVECLHRRSQGHFANPNTFFTQANIMAKPLFAPRSVDTTFTVSLTHEVFSYADGDPYAALRELAERIFEHTAPGGVWLNLDVAGPEDPQRPVVLWLADGPVPGLSTAEIRFRDWSPTLTDPDDPETTRVNLARMSPAARFLSFLRDFRPQETRTDAAFPNPEGLLRPVSVAPNAVPAVTSARIASEFLSHWTYIDSWFSEMCETFTYLGFSSWVGLLSAAGFSVDSRSHLFTNPWVAENRYQPAASLFDMSGSPLPAPPTNVLLVARRL